MPTRREFLEKATASAACTLIGTTFTSAAAVEVPTPHAEIAVFVTDGTRRYTQVEPVRWTPASGTPPITAVIINPAERAQPILGFGAALTDAACYVLSQMPHAGRDSLVNELFSPKEMALSVCRICIGSSDYSRTLFSYDEGEPDPELKRFSVEHDREYILPLLRASRQVNPQLFLLGSPWSPPGWMKDNNSMLGGTIRRRYLKPYADYIVKFLQAYLAEGVEVNAVTPQNEVDTDQDSRMPACLFPQEAEVQYVGEMLGPAIERAGLNTKIWLLDHNYNLWGRAICELDDEKVGKVTKAIAWHGYLGSPELVRKVTSAHPDAEMYWTEGGPGITDPKYLTDWAKWGRTFTGILRNGMRCVIAWNIALDEQGKPNIGPFSCGGVVTVHSGTNEIARSGQHWALSHFSRHIQRNAVVIGSQSGVSGVDHVAVANPDASYSLVLTNAGASSQAAEIHFGRFTSRVDLPADSVVTLHWRT